MAAPRMLGWQRVGAIRLAQLERQVGALELPAPRRVMQRRERLTECQEGGRRLCADRRTASPRAVGRGAARARAAIVRLAAILGWPALPQLPFGADEIGRGGVVVGVHPSMRLADVLLAPHDPLRRDAAAVGARVGVLRVKEPACARAVHGSAVRVTALGGRLDAVVRSRILGKGGGQVAQVQLYRVERACVEQRHEDLLAPVRRRRVQREELQPMPLRRPARVVHARAWCEALQKFERLVRRREPHRGENLRMEVAPCRGLQHVARGKTVLLPRRQAARLGRAERSQPQLQHDLVVDNKAALGVGRLKREQRRDAAVLAVALETPLPRLVEGRERG